MSHLVKKSDFKFMRMILNQCLNKNMGKAMVCVFLYVLIQMFVFAFAVSPIASFAQQQDTALPLASGLFTIAILLSMNVLNKMFAYGLSVVMARFVEKKYVTIGYLFYGFRNKTFRIIRASLIFTLLYALIILGLVLFISIYESELKTLIDTYGVLNVLTLVDFIFLLIQVIIYIPFSFVWILLYNNAELKIFSAFIESAKILKNRFFHFVKFVLCSGGKDLIVTICVILFFIFLPPDAEKITGLGLPTTLLSFAGLISGYKTMVRFYFAIPIYFYSTIGVLRPLKEENAIEEIKELP